MTYDDGWRFCEDCGKGFSSFDDDELRLCESCRPLSPEERLMGVQRRLDETILHLGAVGRQLEESRKTNKRLNRRCQKAESELAECKRTVRSKVRILRAWTRWARAEHDLWRARLKHDEGRERERLCVSCWYKRAFGHDFSQPWGNQVSTVMHNASVIWRNTVKFTEGATDRLITKIRG